MPATHTPARPARWKLSVWRVVTWLLLLLAVFGVFEYCQHAWHVAAGLQAATQPETHAALASMLAWDLAYLAAACITLAAAAGALFWRGWARPVLRVVAVLLALWLLVTAIVLASQWLDFAHRSRMLLEQPGMAEATRGMLERARRSFIAAIVLKGVSVPVLVWLAWRLGVPSVRAQFRHAPARRVG